MYKFIDHRRIPIPINDIILSENKIENMDGKVKILRGCLWYYVGQETTLNDMRNYFSSRGLALLESDGYIKINN